jgi:uncharacterized protein (TIGR03083 family)
VVLDDHAYRLFVDALAHECDVLYARVAELEDLDTPVPTCPGWTARRLLAHVGEVQRHAGHIVDGRLRTRPERAAAPDGVPRRAFLAWCRSGSARLHEALCARGPGDDAWNWSAQPQVAGFWARRMAHEALMHRCDLELARGVPSDIATGLAADGIAEMFEVMAPRAVERRPRPGLFGTLHVDAVDIRASWTARLRPLAVVAAPGTDDLGAADEPAVRLRGRACDLLLVLWGRAGRSAIELSGDRRVFDAWRAEMSI